MDQIIIQRLRQMPEALKQEVMDFIDFLLYRYKQTHAGEKKPVFGSAKGKYKLSPDFDEPLEDFEAYM